jgi:hypothetical protein
MATSTDYDAPRTITADDSLEEMQARRGAHDMTVIDMDESDPAAAFEPLGTELFDEDLTVPVVPMGADEFRCGRCFLVRHRSQRAVAGNTLCQDCA